MKTPSWRRGLERHGAFWSNPRWFDLHLERRMPLALTMLEELTAALPPLANDARVCDLACGTGNASYTILTAYPLLRLTLLDADAGLLEVAQEKIEEFELDDVTVLEAPIPLDGERIPGGPYDAVVTALALSSLLGDDTEPGEAETRLELLFRGAHEALVPGGHLLVGDHVGTLGLYRHLKAMERAGFTDVDCAWREQDFFVIGGRVGE
jgi:SAM-dependent methyltransferase